MAGKLLDGLRPLVSVKNDCPDRYQKRCLETWTHANPTEEFLHAVLGMTGEAGEMADKAKKAIWKQGYVYSRDDCLKELGDLFYYIAMAAHLLGVSIEQLSVANHVKLSGGKHGWGESTDEVSGQYTMNAKEASEILNIEYHVLLSITRVGFLSHEDRGNVRYFDPKEIEQYASKK